LITEGDTLDEAQANVRDAFNAVAELYEEEGRGLPAQG
jgi:predicted RNase H-like HicB family nuclease